MADDLHISRAFRLLQEATVLLSGGIELSSGNINENANEGIVTSTATSNVAVGRNSIGTPTSLNVSATPSISGATSSSHSNGIALQSTPTQTRTTD